MLEEQIVEVIKAELGRQAADKPADLSIGTAKGFRVNGLIDFDALAMAIAGSVAGGRYIETDLAGSPVTPSHREAGEARTPAESHFPLVPSR